VQTSTLVLTQSRLATLTAGSALAVLFIGVGGIWLTRLAGSFRRVRVASLLGLCGAVLSYHALAFAAALVLDALYFHPLVSG
jgi:hypothetical protein